MGIRTMLATALCAAYLSLAGCATETKQWVAAELASGHQSTTFDIKGKARVAPRTSAFFRHRNTTDYENQTANVTVARAEYELLDGLAATAIGQSSAGGTIPRVGLQYFNRWGDFSAYGSAAVRTENHADGEFVLELGYKPQLTDDLGLHLNFEAITILGPRRHRFSTQRSRAYLDVGGWKFGPAVDFVERGEKGHFDYNLGAVLRKEF